MTMFSRVINHGILGINARNLLYIRPFNPRKSVAFADDKLQTKAFLSARGIPTAKIFARIESRSQLREFSFDALPDECVLKPNRGYGGEGILILHRQKDGIFSTKGRASLTIQDLRRHIEDILEGRYSLNGRPDTAFFEQLLTAHECFAPFRPVGLPDLRIIVFNLVPVMAMLRIPTAESGGKANLHLGGIGIGIDLAKGVTTYAAQYHRIVDRLPHGLAPSGIKIPFWDDILLMCSRIQQLTNIGYIACDITICKEMGPALLEVNARAGLSVQIANLAPLRSRLERVLGVKVSVPEKGVRLGQDLFGQKRIKEEAADDRQILGLQEVITVAMDGASMDVLCSIAPERERTVFDPSLIEELRREGVLETEDAAAGTYRMKFMLGKRKIQTLVAGGAVPSPFRALIGKRDLVGFLLDPAREQPASLRPNKSGIGVRAADRLFSQIDEDLSMLQWLKPTNLLDELSRLQQDRTYNPRFSYPSCGDVLEDAERRLEEEVIDDSAQGVLLEKKRKELLQRIALLRARGNANSFTEASHALFGAPSHALIRVATTALRDRPKEPFAQEEPLDIEKAAQLLRSALARYGLHDWQVVVKSKVVADSATGPKTIFLREGVDFSRPRIDALIAHEIETHALTTENGSHQPLALLRRGCAYYLDTQEGLAIYNQNRVLPPFHEKRYGPARSVLGIVFGLKHSFAKTRQYLEEELRYSSQKALTKTIDIKRGLKDTSEHGGFTKGVTYLRGLRAIERFVDGGGDLRRLYIGKVSLRDLDLIEKIPSLLPPLLLPSYLRGESANEKERE
ncbi:TPA: hypothetical protein DCL30_01405 [Candidatus Peribacteria bacterium]|nr:MAG: hypothetical protein A2529_02815 [Candidatus Peribacteria bacterium RIFOXYD2_FULL_58_15]HAI98184.1 hypothetical protein [Candidatus Peribacteria bacterium]HAS34535.1 hypothetical protein [Candidatus Peribacteria bacterium]